MTKARKNLYWGFGIYFIVLVFYISSKWTQPLWDKFDPHIFGLPFIEFNIALVQVLIAVGLAVFFVLDRKLQNKEKAMREAGEKVEY